MSAILLVEDDNTLGMTLEISLVGEGHSVRWCTTLASADRAWRELPPDLIVLDLGLPDGDGLAFCKTLRQEGVIAPILMLTARGTLEARIDGLRLGADDYVSKPFELPELLARIEALLRRRRWHGAGDRVRIGLLDIDFRRREAWRGDDRVELTALEMDLLRYLLDRPGEVVRREELLARVWGVAPTSKTRTVDVFMSRIRRLVEPDPATPRHLLSIRGQGYRLDLKVP